VFRVSGVNSLRALFVALNDEERVVRGLAIMVVGRLALHNPAYVMPALRRHLMQLLNDMNTAQDYSQREGAALTYHGFHDWL
jgi:serine/threonine-protein kinase mTOR